LERLLEGGYVESRRLVVARNDDYGVLHNAHILSPGIMSPNRRAPSSSVLSSSSARDNQRVAAGPPCQEPMPCCAWPPSPRRISSTLASRRGRSRLQKR